MINLYKDVSLTTLKGAMSWWREYADEMSDSLMEELQAEFTPMYPIDFMKDTVKEFQKAIDDGDTEEAEGIAREAEWNLRKTIKKREEQEK